MTPVQVLYVFGISSFPFFFLLLDMVTGAVLFKPDVVIISDEKCEEPEVYSPCQASQICERSCDNIDVWDSIPCIQTKNCVSGCICKEGYVREKAEGVCILENRCPRVRH